VVSLPPCPLAERERSLTIGIICAIAQEIEHLEAVTRVDKQEEIAGRTYRKGSLDSTDIVLVGAGIGKVNTAMTATILIRQFGCRLLVFSGVAGGIDPSLNIGDVVIAERAIHHDSGVIQNERVQTYQAGHVPFFNPTDRLGYDSNADLMARVRSVTDRISLAGLSSNAGGTGNASKLVFGTILAGDQFLNCEATRQRLVSELGGQAIEMEGAALAQVCEAFSVDWLNIRALSDLAGQEAHFDFGSFVSEVASRSAEIVRSIIKVA